jgi:aryl-alcohol dehydrogenase-like predicted oxidoreductase
MQARIDSHRDQLEQWEKLCAGLGEEPSNVALAWLLSNPVVTAPIIGPRTLDQFTGALGCLELTLDDEVVSRLDTIFPGPGGPAPEAYAW